MLPLNGHLSQGSSESGLYLFPDSDIEIVADNDGDGYVSLWRKTVVTGIEMGARLEFFGTFSNVAAARRHADDTGLSGEWIADKGNGHADRWFVGRIGLHQVPQAIEVS